MHAELSVISSNSSAVSSLNAFRLYVAGALVMLGIALWTIFSQLRFIRFKNPWWAIFSCGRAVLKIQFFSNLMVPLLFAVVSVRYAIDRWNQETELLPFSAGHHYLNCAARALFLASGLIPLFCCIEIIVATRISPIFRRKVIFPGFFYNFFIIELVLSFLFCRIFMCHDLVFLIVPVVLTVITSTAAILLTIWEYERSIEELSLQSAGYRIDPERKYNIKIIAMILSQAISSLIITLSAIYFYMNNSQHWEIPHCFPFPVWIFGKISTLVDLDRWYSPTVAQRIASGPLTAIGRPALRCPRNMEENIVPIAALDQDVGCSKDDKTEFFTFDDSTAGPGSNEPPAEETSCPL